MYIYFYIYKGVWKIRIEKIIGKDQNWEGWFYYCYKRVFT